MFAQHININDMVNSQEFMKICTEHPECKGCPLVNGQVVDGLFCENGKTKGEEYK